MDLRDYPMPFFSEPVSPAMSDGKYSNEIVNKWSEKIMDGDAFIIVTPEYNHGYPAVLKNALDSIFPEGNRKAVGFVSYGNAGGMPMHNEFKNTNICNMSSFPFSECNSRFSPSSYLLYACRYLQKKILAADR